MGSRAAGPRSRAARRAPPVGGAGGWVRGVVVAAVAMASVGAAPGAAPPATITESLNALRVILPNEPVAAPEFALDGLEGRRVSLKDFRGKVVFLNFWATWCVPCRREMPAMERLHRAYGGRGLAMVGVNFKESPAEVKAFMDELRLTFPALLDTKGTVTVNFGVRSLPVTFLVDRDGKILWKAFGRRDWDGPHGTAYFQRLFQPRAQ